jgi:hypothetical protein
MPRPADSLVEALVSRWLALRSEGQEVPPEELCRDQPALLPELRRRLGVLGRVEKLAGAQARPAPTGHVRLPSPAGNPGGLGGAIPGVWKGWTVPEGSGQGRGQKGPHGHEQRAAHDEGEWQ